MNYYKITEFTGIQQQKDGALLPVESASDARNVDTADGNLCVAKGYAKHIQQRIPGTDKILKILISRGDPQKFYVVTANSIYAHTGGAWESVYAFSSPIAGEQVDYLQTRIATDDCIVVSTGHQQMLKIKLSDDSVSLFGSGLYSFDGSVTAYDNATKTVTLSNTLNADAARHAPLDGIVIAGSLLSVASASENTVTLKEEPQAAPVSGDPVTIRGGGSDAACNFIDLYYGRLFSSGDPANPSRVYWSAAPGEGRTIEDWLSATGSEEASGGYVDVGDASGDAIIGMCVLSTQLLIFKRYSVYRLYGDRPSTYAVERVENFSMNMSNACVVVKYDMPYWFTLDGMFYYDGTGILPTNYGYRILKRFIASISSVSASKGCHCNNMLYFTCKVNSAATYDDAIIVYDPARESFMIRDGFEVADLAVSDGHMYMINGERCLYEFNKGRDYDGEPIRAYWITQPTDLSAKSIKKQILELMFRGSDGHILFTVRSGANNVYVQKNLFPENDGFVRVPINIDMSRVFEIRMENEAGSYFEINGGLDVGFTKEERKR